MLRLDSKGFHYLRKTVIFSKTGLLGWCSQWVGLVGWVFFPRDSSVLPWFYMDTVSHFLLSLNSLEHCAWAVSIENCGHGCESGLIQRPCKILIFKGSDFYPFPLLQDAREYLCHTETCMPAVRESSVPKRIFFSLGTDACKPSSGFPGGVIALLHFCYRLQQPLRIG